MASAEFRASAAPEGICAWADTIWSEVARTNSTPTGPNESARSMTTSGAHEVASPRSGPRRWVSLLLERAAEHAGWLIGVVSVFAALAAAALAGRGGDGVSFYDEGDYFALAVNLADFGGYSLDGETATAFRPPGLPVALSLVARLSPELTTLRIANALLFGVVVFLAARLARRLSGDLAGVLAAVGVAVAPVGVYTATKLYPQTLASVLILGTLAALVALERADTPRRRLMWAAASGLALAGLTLTVPNHGVTLVVGVLWLIWRLRRDAVLPLLVLVVAFALPVGAWTARNASAMDAFVPVSTNGGINLLLGNIDGAGAGTGTNVDIDEHIGAANRLGLDEVDTDKYLRDVALDWIEANPVDAGQLFLAKFANNFTIEQELATADEQPSRAETLLIGVTYLPVLLLFLIRPLLHRRVPVRRGEGLLIAVFWANVLATAVAFTRIRFRVPLDPIMVIIAATLVAGLLRQWLALPTEVGPQATGTDPRAAAAPEPVEPGSRGGSH